MQKKLNATRKSLVLIVGIGIILIWTITSVVGLLISMSRIEKESSDKSFSALADSNAMQVRRTFEGYVNTIKIASMAIEEKYNKEDRNAEGGHEFISAMSILKNMAKTQGYERLAIDYIDGIGYTTDDRIVDVSKFEYLDKIKKGETFVYDVVNAIADDKPVVSLLVPLRDDSGNPLASLRCTITTQSLSKHFEETLALNGGYFHLVDLAGNFVASSDSKNSIQMRTTLYDEIDKLTYDKEFSAEKLKSDFLAQRKGLSKYSYEGIGKFSYYTPTGFNSWMMMVSVPKSLVEQKAIDNLVPALLSLSQIVIILMLIMAHIYYSQRVARERALLNEKCFKVLAEQTNKVIFEWDFNSGKIVAMTSFEKFFGRKAVTQSTAEEALSVKAVHEDDRKEFSSVFESILSGQNVSEKKFRIINSEGVYNWCEMSGIVVLDNKGQPFKAIGTLEKIEERVRKEAELTQKAEMDQLTGLYNKKTTEHLIKQALNNADESSKYALMIMDIDNFKNVNDNFGHLYGDIVLSGLADALKSTFGIDDVIGRVGGDEFFVFLKSYDDISQLTEKAKKLCSLFRNTYIKKNMSIEISVSVGIAISPEHGKSFDELYSNADSALYSMKSSSKNNYCIYDKTMMGVYQSSVTQIETNSKLPQSLLNDKQKENKLRNELKEMMDKSNTLDYVIDAETYNILFENKKLAELTGKVSIGSKCYVAYREKSKPCEDCPRSGLSESVDKCTTLLTNEKYKMLSNTEVIKINWTGEKDACLVSITDVSEYMKDHNIIIEKSN